MRRATARALVFACVFLGSRVVSQAAVAPDNRPTIQKVYHHPDLWVREHQEKLSELSTSQKASASNELARLGVKPDLGFYDSRVGRFVSLVLSEPLIPGTGRGNSLHWAGSGARPSDSAIQEQTWNAASAFLSRHQSELRLDSSEFGSPRVTVLEKGNLVYVYIPRSVGGVPVRNSSIGFTINHGNLVLLGLQNWGLVSTSLTPSFSADQARSVAVEHAAPYEATFEKAAHLELIPVSPDDTTLGYRLGWVSNLRLAGDIGNWEAIVDAHTGELLNFEDKNDYAQRQIFGGVYPVSNDQRPPDGIEQAGWPMPFADIHNGPDVTYTDQGGNIGCIVGSISSHLSGKFLQMTDNCGAVNESGMGDLDLGSGPSAAATDCTTPGAGHSAGDTKSSRTGYFELNQLIQRARGWLPDNTWLDQQLNANMNINSTCNAFWDGGSVNFFKSGGGCRNTGEIAAIFDHEWGHGLDNNGANPNISGPGEAVADISAITRLNESCAGRGFFISNVCGGYGDACIGTPATGCTGVRDLDFVNHRCNLPHTITWITSGFTAGQCPTGAPACPGFGQLGPCNHETHCEGYVPAETLWDVKQRDLQAAPYSYDENTALELATRLYLLGSQMITNWYTCAVGGGCGATGGYLLTLAADDDDGDISNGTPHMVGIHAAFARHEIHCAVPAPLDSGCAGAPTTAPTVTTTAIDKGAIVSWDAVSGANSYNVYRTDGVFACDFGKIKVGETTDTTFTEVGLQNGRTYYYSVVPVATNIACFGPMSTCSSVVPAAGANLSILSSSTLDIAGGDGDDFLDNCETGTLTFTVSNTGTGDLTNVRLISVTPISHPTTEILTPLPSAITATLAECAAAQGTVMFIPHGMVFGDTFQLLLEVTADELGAGSRFQTLSVTPVEADSTAVATRTWSFETDLEGWTVTSGTYFRQAPGANGTGFHLSSSENVDNECDIIDSPTIRLTGTSTLSLYNHYTTENPVPIPYDRANVGIRDLVSNTRTTVVPSGGRAYDLLPGTANGSCVTNGQAGWAGTQLAFAQSSWNAAALNPGGIFTGKAAAIEVAYGTDSGTSLAGLDFDEVVLTNFEEIGPDQQSDVCVPIISVQVNAIDVDSGGNGVLETGETALLEPTWENVGNVDVTMTGTLTNFTGPGDGAGITYTIVPPGTADYGSIVVGASQKCTTCYSLQINGGTRPVQHWDATATETVSPLGPPFQQGGGQVYTLHVGNSFTDVSSDLVSDPFYPSIETLVHNGVTAGCGDGSTYCPTQNVLRQEMAVFLLKSFLTSSYVPPACTPPGQFTDVACPGLYTDYIEDLKTRNITAGCGDGTTFCPDANVLRQEMAVFLLKTLLGGSYVPPACTPPGQFTDVACPGQYTDFIEDLKTRGITAGCGDGTTFCPTAPVTRQEMAAFLTITFSLVLYGP